MMQYFLLVYAGTAVLLVLEILAGRHRGAYERGDVPLIAGSLLGRQVIGPITTGLITAAYGAVAPATKGALAGANPWLVFAGLLLLTEFVFYWVHRWAHENRKARLPLGAHALAEMLLAHHRWHSDNFGGCGRPGPVGAISVAAVAACLGPGAR